MANLSNINNKFIVEDSGDVGIGVTTATTKLHIGGTAPGDSIIRQDSTVSGTNWEIGERAAGKWQIFEDDGDSIVATFMSSGNVGIGTTGPTEKLDVSGTAIVRSTLFTVGNVHGFTSTYGASFFINNGGGTTYFNATGGNVGIGTTGPTAKLQIGSNVDPSQTAESLVHLLSTTTSSTVNGFVHLKLDYHGGVNQYDPGATIMFNQSYHSGNLDYTQPTGAIRGYRTTPTQYGYGGGVQLLYQPSTPLGILPGLSLDHLGNIGIGTTTPNAKLDVKNNDGVASGLHIIADFNQNAGAGAQMILGYYANGTAAVGPLIYAANGMPQLINASGGIRFSNDLTFSSSFLYTFRDAVGINNPNSISATPNAGYTMCVGRSNNGAGVSGSISAVGTIRASAFTTGINTTAGIGASNGDVNASETGPGYINLSRDDTAAAQQIRFEKNGALHSYIETTTSGLNIGNANVYLAKSTNQGQLFFGTADNQYEIFGGGTWGYMGYNTSGYHRFFGSGTETMRITNAGDVQIPIDSASLQLRSSGSASYTSIRRDAANQLIVANTAGNQVFGIGNGGELAITNGASYSAQYTYTSGWNSTYQTLIPGANLSPNAVYLVTIKCNSLGAAPYYASTVFHIATSPGTNGGGGSAPFNPPTATHVSTSGGWVIRISTIVNGRNGLEGYLGGGPTNFNGATIYVKATKIMTL